MAWHDVWWSSLLRTTDLAWLSLAWPGLAWLGQVRPGVIWCGMVWPGLVYLAWSGQVRSGLVWSGRVWSGLVGSTHKFRDQLRLIKSETQRWTVQKRKYFIIKFDTFKCGMNKQPWGIVVNRVSHFCSCTGTFLRDLLCMLKSVWFTTLLNQNFMILKIYIVQWTMPNVHCP